MTKKLITLGLIFLLSSYTTSAFSNSIQITEDVTPTLNQVDTSEKDEVIEQNSGFEPVSFEDSDDYVPIVDED